MGIVNLTMCMCNPLLSCQEVVLEPVAGVVVATSSYIQQVSSPCIEQVPSPDLVYINQVGLLPAGMSEEPYSCCVLTKVACF